MSYLQSSSNAELARHYHKFRSKEALEELERRDDLIKLLGSSSFKNRTLIELATQYAFQYPDTDQQDLMAELENRQDVLDIIAKPDSQLVFSFAKEEKMGDNLSVEQREIYDAGYSAGLKVNLKDEGKDEIVPELSERYPI